MRKHYVTAVSGILLIAVLFALSADSIDASNSGMGIACNKDSTIVGPGDKIISGASNAVSYVAERLIEMLSKLTFIIR